MAGNLKPDAEIADAQPELGGMDALQFLHLACAGFGEALDRVLHLTGISLLERSHIVE